MQSQSSILIFPEHIHPSVTSIFKLRTFFSVTVEPFFPENRQLYTKHTKLHWHFQAARVEKPLGHFERVRRACPDPPLRRKRNAGRNSLVPMPQSEMHQKGLANSIGRDHCQPAQRKGDGCESFPCIHMSICPSAGCIMCTRSFGSSHFERLRSACQRRVVATTLSGDFV